MKLSATFIARAKDQGRYADGGGLVFVVGKNPKNKSWFFKSRIVFGCESKSIDKKIGSYPEMSLADARELATSIKSAYQNGFGYFDNHIEHVLTFEELAQEWIELKRKKGMRENTIATDQKRLDKHILPILKDIPVKDIDKKMLRAICEHSAITAPYTANRIAGMFQGIFELAVISDIIESSPAQYLTKLYPKPKTSNNPYLLSEEIPELLTALKMALQFELIDIVTYHMILIQFHTLSRPAEIATLKWGYIDFNNKSWTIPAKMMKNKQEHTQPLSLQVMHLLSAQRLYCEESDYVFPSAKRNAKTPHRNKETANTALKKRLKYKDRLTAHGLRHTAATTLGAMGYARDLIDVALSHFVGNEVSRTYNKDNALEKRRKMLDHWSSYLSDLEEK